ncbi:GspE/PulE family protein [Synoicihabitans lomoniglobus]|uniref:GspE/PulE family protein n=1 Tax=Synoicihabitans lomoniglobus TaxID=2909285 RepID=A0AAF0I5T5_9BACT|nr:GspE/PulE family protein [Opitutaceae bacterium LMO-M01]WED67200.1 GspE/PulE family protein [Opitutaceae bacterium LMO-M01]
MFEAQHHAVLDFLRERELLDPEQLAATEEEHAATGRTAAEVALDHGWIEPAAMLAALARHLGCELAADLPSNLPGDAVALLPGNLARMYGVAPLRYDAAGIDVLAVDPFNARVVEDLTFALGRDVRMVVAAPERIEALIKQHYGEDDATLEELIADIDEIETEGEDAALSTHELEAIAGQAPIVRFVNLVLAQAIKDNASDVHFEPFESDYKIRYRVDGALYEMAPPPRHLALPIASRIKVLANLNIAERRVPQDGRIKITLGGRPVDLRVSTLPTQFGESVVLRVLDQSAVRLDLEQLRLPATIERGIRDTLRRPNGIFIVTGPTGSGKTTTLYSALKELNDTERKLLTAEDPVEYEIEGVMQVPINPGIGLSFARALRTFLRQDPDVIMIGEIRDLETAQIAIQASLTGHLVLATLHTNDAPGAITRLIDMGVEPYLISASLEAVLAQRLVRCVCADCRESYPPDDALLEELGLTRAELAKRSFFRGRGCSRCHGTGYRGRHGLFEWLPVNEPLREQVARGVASFDLRDRAIADGMVPLRQAGIAAILDGVTSAEEVLQYT